MRELEPGCRDSFAVEGCHNNNDQGMDRAVGSEPPHYNRIRRWRIVSTHASLSIFSSTWGHRLTGLCIKYVLVKFSCLDDDVLDVKFNLEQKNYNVDITFRNFLALIEIGRASCRERVYVLV